MSPKSKRYQACVALMKSALATEAGLILELPTERSAKRYRENCYKIREALAAVGDFRFEGLRFVIRENNLKLEKIVPGVEVVE